MATGRWMKCMAVLQAVLALADLGLLAEQATDGRGWQGWQTATLILHVMLLGLAPLVWRENIWAVRASALGVLAEVLAWLPLCAAYFFIAFKGADVFKDSPGLLLVLCFFTGTKILPDMLLFFSYLAWMVRRARQRTRPVQEGLPDEVG